MRQLLFSILCLFAVSSIQAQNGTSYTKIMAAFEQWKTSSIQKGKYATAANCKMEIVTKDGYKGPNTGIPQDLSIHFADVIYADYYGELSTTQFLVVIRVNAAL